MNSKNQKEKLNPFINGDLENIAKIENIPPHSYPADSNVKKLLTNQPINRSENDCPKWPADIYSSFNKSRIGNGAIRFKKIPGCP